MRKSVIAYLYLYVIKIPLDIQVPFSYFMIEPYFYILINLICNLLYIFTLSKIIKIRKFYMRINEE